MSARLEELQTALGEAWRQFRSFKDDPGLARMAETYVSQGARLSPQEQAEIYREQFWFRHRDVLREDFPGLRHLLGDEAFDSLCRAYLTAHPPGSFTLRDLGHSLSRFADDYPHFTAALVGPACDMARFEAAFIDIFDGPDRSPADLERLENIEDHVWPTVTIELHPQLVLLSLRYPVHRLRSALRRGEAPSATLTPETNYLAMYRGADLKVHYRPIEAPQYELLENLRAGRPFIQALDLLAQGVPEDEHEALGPKLQGWFHDWGARGWIVDVQQGAAAK